MAIEVRQLDSWDEARWKTWLETHIRPHLKPDVSNYAKGRLRVWIGEEPPLFRDGIYQPGLQLPNFTTALKERIGWDFDHCLITFSTERAIGIEPHRDAGTLSYEAYGLGLVGTAEFLYWDDRPGFGPGRPATRQLKPNDEPTHRIQMGPGTLVHFNSKCLHAAQPIADRWALNVWRRK